MIRWIEDLLLRILGQIGRYPIGVKILFWVITIGVIVWLALVLFRYWTRRATLEELQAPDSVAYVRTWQEWIQAAREAATRGDLSGGGSLRLLGGHQLSRGQSDWCGKIAHARRANICAWFRTRHNSWQQGVKRARRFPR